MRWRPSRYNVPDVMRGPRFTSTGPVQEPPPPRLIRFPVWAAQRVRVILAEIRLNHAMIPWVRGRILRQSVCYQ